MKVEAREIVEMFDECLGYIFGSTFVRDNPHKTDFETATRWIDEGVNTFLAAAVFSKQMEWMHEKYLRYQDRKNVPHSLSVFNENIESAIRRKENGGQFDDCEREYSRWRSRCKGWMKNNKLWQPEQWGPEPFKSGCRVPKAVLNEISAA